MGLASGNCLKFQSDLVNYQKKAKTKLLISFVQLDILFI